MKLIKIASFLILFLNVSVCEECICEKEDQEKVDEKIHVEKKHGVVLTSDYLRSLGFGHSATLFNLKNLDIIELHPDAFEEFPNATLIDLSHNRIKKIDSQLFRNQYSLVELKLNNNQIEEIEPQAFDSLDSVQLFDISNNRLSGVLPADLINPMVNIHYFQASSNSIEDIQWDLILLQSVEMFNVSSNKISVLSVCNGTITPTCPIYGTWPLLFLWKGVDLSNNKLNKIGKYDLYLVKDIETFDVSNNEIEYIDSESFKFNSHLIELNFQNNNLTRIEFNTFDSFR